MDDVTPAPATGSVPKRGQSASYMRAFTCKDCQREIDHVAARLAELERSGGTRSQLKKARGELAARRDKAVYNENWARSLVERGGSRSDRCKDHRLKHRTNIQGMAVAYIDLQTVGEVTDRENPSGPLGGLGPLPVAHEVVAGTSFDLQDVKVGMTDEHVTQMIKLLRDKRVLILKAGTGTGKSTFAPYRLMDPPPESLRDLPPGAPFARLTDLGPVIVTEPRVQAAVGVATFVGGTMSGAGGVGPGFPVGYQVSGDRNHDEACELVYVTDGTMINWLREGRLSRIGTVIVDEAHERSTNIDFIMGYLKQEIARYPHLRVIITSATFNTDFYQEYFGGPGAANVMEVPAEKTFGYGMPLFPALDTAEDGEEDIYDRWTDESLPLSRQRPRDEAAFIRQHWPERYAPPLGDDDVVGGDDGVGDAERTEDVWDTTAKLIDLRYDGHVPVEEWRERMPGEMAKFIIQLAKGLDEQGIFGDILGFLPTKRTIEPVCEEIERALGRAYRDNVFPLISTLSPVRQRKALAKRRKGDPRKIVISTNLAETSLTVEGVRFVVDSGVIAQSEWDPGLAQGGIPTKPHSQAGIKQRWGRVGRKAPGWVFPLYSKGQYVDLAQDTPPGSARENLEALVMTAKMGGIDDVAGFPWPAAFQPTTTELDASARDAREVFLRELSRADLALRAGGAVDSDGHPTSFGKELTRFQGLGSTASALAVLYADRLACVPEVVTILALLEDTRLIGRRGLLQDDYEWPDEWRLEAADRHRGLATLCADDAELALLAAAAWERADPDAAPWDQSERRKTWARQWWVSHEVLLEAAVKRHETLLALSPAMKEDVKRFLEPALIGRARGVLTRTFAAHCYERDDAGGYRSAHDGEAVFTAEDDMLIVPQSPRVIALRRRESRTENRVSSLVTVQPWALPGGEPGTGEPDAGGHERAPGGAADAMRMIVAAAKSAPPQPELTQALHYLASWPAGQRVRVEFADGEPARVANIVDHRDPFRRPQTDAERGVTGERRGKRRRQTADDELPQGTRADSDGEIRLRQRAAGYADEDAERAAEFRAADYAAAAPVPCSECFPCLDGRPDDCENPDTGREPSGKRSNPLHAWLHAARAGQDVSRPAVIIEPGPAAPGDWYEVAGYARAGDGTIAVRLRPDWRAGRPGNPAQHVDVKAGDPIEVTVGPVLRHHGGDLRSFERTDGLGRFVVAEASSRRADVQERRREIAVSLDRGSTALLAGLAGGGVLTATVVPARADGCYTITLLELLHQHWAKAQSGNGVEYHVLDQTRRNAARKPLYAAVVEEPPNENGFAAARLLHQDGALGIRHHFDFNAGSRGGPEAACGGEAAAGQARQVARQVPDPEPGQAGQAPAGQPLQVGTPLLLNIVTDQSRLEVSGLDLDVLTGIVANSQRQLELTGVRDDEGKAGRSRKDKADRDEEDGERLAPPGATLRPTTDKPLSRAAAELLCDLSDEPGWPNEVWSFWARSHHLMTHRQQPFLPGQGSEPFDVPARVILDTASPLERQRQRVAGYRAEKPAGTVVECVVTQVANQGAFVELGPDIEGLIPSAELSWAARPGHPSQTVAPGDRLRALLTAVPDPPARIQLSVRALVPDPFAAFQAAHPAGATVRGLVRAVTDSHAYLVLADDVEGVIHVSQLAWQRVERARDVLTEGAQIDARVLSYDAERRRAELSRKALFPKPYEAFKRALGVDDVVIGEIRSATPTHVYVDLGETGYPVAGVIFVREWAYEQDIPDVSVHAPAGRRGKVKIIKFDDKREQVELSRKRLMPDPYDGYKRTHPVGAVVTGRVRRAIPARVFLDLGGGVAGVIHVSQLDHGHVADASGFCPAGTVLEARITGFSDERRQVELSRKDALPRPFLQYKTAHQVGQVVTGDIRNTNRSFAYVDLGNGVQGVIHVSRLAPYRISQPADVVSAGQRIQAQIIDFDEAREQVVLTRYA